MNNTQKVLVNEHIDGASPFRGSFKSKTSPLKLTVKMGELQFQNIGQDSDNLSSTQKTVIKNVKPSLENFNQTIQLSKEFDLSDNTLKGVDMEALSQLSQSLKTVEILRQSIIDKIQLNSKQNSQQSLSRKNSQSKFDPSETQNTHQIMKIYDREDYYDNIDLPLQIDRKVSMQHFNKERSDKSPITSIKIIPSEVYDSATVEKRPILVKKEKASQSKQTQRVLGNLGKRSAIMDQILSGGNFKNQRNSSLKRNNFAYSSFQNEAKSENKLMNSKTQLNNYGVQIRKFELNSNEKASINIQPQERKRYPISIDKFQKRIEQEKKPDATVTYRSKDSQIRKPQFLEKTNSRMLIQSKKQNLKNPDIKFDQKRLNFTKNKSQDHIAQQRKPAIPLQNKGARFSIPNKISPQRALYRSYSKVLEVPKALNKEDTSVSLTRVKKMTASRSFVTKPWNTKSELQKSVSSHHVSIDNAQETQREMFRKASEKVLVKQRGLKKQLEQVSSISLSKTREQDLPNDPTVPSYMRPLNKNRQRDSVLRNDSSHSRILTKSISNQKLQLESKYSTVNGLDRSPLGAFDKKMDRSKNSLGISAQVKLLKQTEIQNFHTQSISSHHSTIKADKLQKPVLKQSHAAIMNHKNAFENMSKSTWNIQNTEQESEYLPSQSKSFLSVNQRQGKAGRPKIVLNSHFDKMIEQRILSPPSAASGMSLGTQFSKVSNNLNLRSHLSNMPLSMNPYVQNTEQMKALSKVRKSQIDFTQLEDEPIAQAPTMQSSTPKTNSNTVPQSFNCPQNSVRDQKYSRSSSVLHLNLNDQFTGKSMVQTDACQKNQGQQSLRRYMAQTYSSSQAPLQRCQSNQSFSKLRFDPPSQRDIQTSSRMQRRQEKNSDRLELLKKARQLGNKYSEKIAKEVRSRSRKVEQKEFETLLGRTSNISSPEKQLQAELFAQEMEGTGNIEINILNPEIILDTSVVPLDQSQLPSFEKPVNIEIAQGLSNFYSAPEPIPGSRFEKKRRSSKEVLRQKRLQLEKKEALKQAQKQKFQRLQLSLRFLNMNLGAVVLGYKTRRIYFNSEIIRKHRIEYRDLIQFAFMLQTEINQLKHQINLFKQDNESLFSDLDISQETLRVTIIEMKNKREQFQLDFAKLEGSENSQWMGKSLPKEVQDILYEQASKFEQAKISYKVRKQNKLQKIKLQREMQNNNKYSQNLDIDNLIGAPQDSDEFERQYKPQPISQSPIKKHMVANKQELSLITEQLSPEMRQDSVSHYDMKNVSYSSPQHYRQSIQSKLKHSIISQGSRQRASKFESKIPRIDSSAKRSYCSRSNKSRSNIKSRIPTINVSKAQKSQIEALQDDEIPDICTKFPCELDDDLNFATTLKTFNGQIDQRNQEAQGLRNDLNTNLEMSLLKLEASNSFLEGKDCDISRIEQLQSNQDLISPNNVEQFNLSRHCNDNLQDNSFKLSPCKVDAQQESEIQPPHIFASFEDLKSNKRYVMSHIVTKSPKKKATSKVSSPFKKSPKKVKKNHVGTNAQNSPEKENSLYNTQASQISNKTGRRSRGLRGSSKRICGDISNRLITSQLKSIVTSSFQLNEPAQKQQTKRVQITSNFVRKELPLGFDGVTPKNVQNKTAVFSERFDMSSPEKSRSPIKKSEDVSPCKELRNSTQTLTQIQEMLMSLQQNKKENKECQDKENFKKLLGNLQMQFESLIDK